MQYISGEARKPSIFVSSTCYDLKQIRQDIREFIEADLLTIADNTLKHHSQKLSSLIFSYLMR